MARRTRPVRTPATITAGATRINLADGRRAAQQAARRQEWQQESWAYAEEVPEIGFALDFLGNSLGKLRLYAGVRPVGAEPNSIPIPVDAEESDIAPELAASAVAEIDRLATGMSGMAGLLRRANMNLEVPGEFYLVGRGATAQEPEEWTVRSTDEIHVAQDGAYHLLNGLGDHPTDNNRLGFRTGASNNTDTVIRMWQEHPRWQNRPWSAMRRLNGECRSLQVLSQLVLAQAMRAASAGFMTWPNQLSVGAANPATPEQVEEGQEPVDPLSAMIANVLMGPIEDPSDPASVQPGLIRGEAEWLKPDYLRIIRTWDPQVDDSLDRRIESRVGRIARGINLPVEVIEGHMQTTFANAGQVNRDTFEDYLEPRCLMLAQLFGFGFLRPNLRDSHPGDPDVERVVCWYDASAIIAQPDREKNAVQAHERFLISDRSARGALGFDEDDAATPEEILTRAALNQTRLGPQIAAALLQPIGQETPGVDVPQPDQLAPGSTSTAASALAELLAAARRPPLALPAVARPVRASGGRGFGWELMDIDRDLRTRLIAASNAAMNRALERAGNRLRSAAVNHRSVLRNVPALSVGATIGRETARSVLAAGNGGAPEDAALAGAWDDLERDFLAWAAAAGAGALSLARSVVTLSDADAAVLSARQAQDVADAWAWMRTALTDLASQRMFDPDPLAPAFGEFDASLRVPPALVRQAMARAGGTSGLVTDGRGGAFVAVADSGARAAGGIATGDLLMGALADRGVTTEGYEWVYGPAYRSRPFEPHERLSGQQFANFDDPVLANFTGWPGSLSMPGDHDGCVCDAVAVLIVPAQQSAA